MDLIRNRSKRAGYKQYIVAGQDIRSCPDRISCVRLRHSYNLIFVRENSVSSVEFLNGCFFYDELIFKDFRFIIYLEVCKGRSNDMEWRLYWFAWKLYGYTCYAEGLKKFWLSGKNRSALKRHSFSPYLLQIPTGTAWLVTGPVL